MFLVSILANPTGEMGGWVGQKTKMAQNVLYFSIAKGFMTPKPALRDMWCRASNLQEYFGDFLDLLVRIRCPAVWIFCCRFQSGELSAAMEWLIFFLSF
jgi:hypothetical protein